MKRVLLAGSMIVLSACNVSTTSTTSGDPGPKEQIGAITGMVVGGAIANDMAEGSKNEGLATVLGAFIGGVMGQSIGSQLDELDRLMAQSAYNEALEYNRSDVSTDSRVPQHAWLSTSSLDSPEPAEPPLAGGRRG